MTTKIMPQEFLFQESCNPIQVQTTCAKELLDDPKMFLPHIKHFNLSAGTVILVQVMNETKDKLLHEAEFRVIAAVLTIHGVSDDYGSKVREQTAYQIQRWSEWKSTELVEEKKAEVVSEMGERYVPGESVIKWNPGKKTYEIRYGDEILATQRDKNLALSIAAGSEPLPNEAV
jgi:hypothetical protein